MPALERYAAAFGRAAQFRRAVLTRADGSTETLRLRPQDGCVTLQLDSDVVSLVLQPVC